MDYREIENRFERNRDMIKERANDKLVQEIKAANRQQRTPLLVSLRSMFSNLIKRRGNIVEPIPQAQVKPQRQIKQH